MGIVTGLGARLLFTAGTVVGVVTLVFVLVRLTPGDPAALLMGDYAGRATPDEMRELRARLGLERPIGEQYLIFLGRVGQGDLGVSYRTRSSVAEEIGANIGATAQLLAAGLGIAILLGVPIGVFAAVRHNRPSDYLVMASAMVALASPSFWLAIVLVYAFGYRLGWFPIFGAAQGADALRALVLPAAVVGSRSAALIARMTRSSMLEVMGQDYVRTARAKGLPERAVLYGHALRNAALPVLTIIGLDMAFLVSGAVVIETVFSRPGLGKLVVDAMFARDYPVIQGVMLVFAVGVVLINGLVDLAYRLIDPRLRSELV